MNMKRSMQIAALGMIVSANTVWARQMPEVVFEREQKIQARHDARVQNATRESENPARRNSEIDIDERP
jgi:hypothetical protein